MHNYIIHPSARVFIPPHLYYDAVDAIAQTPSCFCDGESILVPEAETEAISTLRDRFSGTVEYGHGQEGEFATKAIAAGVGDRLVSLGHSLQQTMDISPDAMVAEALANPEMAWERWGKIYLREMGVSSNV